MQPVGNGLEVLQAVACEQFDLVLMDVQMPEMDGLEATVAIRQQERTSGRHMPIIAMTAHAMKGDRERCLEAGMDDYLAKPVDPVALHAMLYRFGGPSNASHKLAAEHEMQKHTDCPADPLAHPLNDQVEIFDLAGLRARVENDLDLLTEMLELYLDSSPRLMEEIEKAITCGDPHRTARAAHTLKGVLRNLCAGSCAETALKLEESAGAGDLASADQTLVTLKEQYEHLRHVVTGIVNGAAI